MGASLTGRLADPQFRKDRAEKAGRARTKLSYHVQQVIDRAPELPNEVVEELRQLLPPDATPDDREAA